MDSEDRLLWNRAFDKFDELERKVTDLCINMASVKDETRLTPRGKGGSRPKERKGILCSYNSHG
jgi:hypothetical protein